MSATNDPPWRAVGRHRFDTPDELDATLTTTLTPESERLTRIRGIDIEEAENLLASAREADVELEVQFRIDDRAVRIDSAGVVSVREER